MERQRQQRSRRPGQLVPPPVRPIAEPGPNDLAIIEFGPALTGTLNIGALDLVQQGPGEPAFSMTGPSTQVTASSAGIANTVSLEAGANLQVGTLSTAAGCAVLVTGAGTDLNGGSVALAGTITLDDGAAMQASTLSIAGTTTVTVRGDSTLDASVSTGNTMTVGNSAGNTLLLIIAGGGTLQLTGSITGTLLRRVLKGAPSRLCLPSAERMAGRAGHAARLALQPRMRRRGRTDWTPPPSNTLDPPATAPAPSASPAAWRRSSARW